MTRVGDNYEPHRGPGSGVGATSTTVAASKFRLRLPVLALLTLHLFVVASVTIWLFNERQHLLFWYLDGGFVLDLIRSQADWASRFGLTFDPIRGPFGFFNAGPSTNYWMLPIFWLQDLLLDGEFRRVATYVAYALTAALMLSTAAIVLRLPITIGILATWIFLALTTPMFWGGGGTLWFPLYILAPHFFDPGLVLSLCVVAFALLKRATWLRAVVIGGFVGLLLSYYTTVLPATILLVLPPFIMSSLILIALSASRRELLVKLIIVAGIATVISVSGLIMFARALVLFTQPAYFPSEIPPYQFGLAWSSILYKWDVYPYAALLSFVTGIGSFAVVLVHRNQLKSSIKIQLTCVLSCLTVGMWLVWPVMSIIDSYIISLPFIYQLRLLYFETTFLLGSTLFVACLANAVLMRLLVALKPSIDWTKLRGTGAGVLTAILIAAVAIHLIRLGPLDGFNPYTYPPTKTDIVSALEEKIALMPGQPFRGRVASLTDGDAQTPDYGWDRMIGDDLAHIRVTGNDHRFFGLWHFDVPTLQQYSQNISPAIYFLATRAFSSPTIKQDQRNSYLMSAISEPFFRLLGVRYVIADAADPAISGKQAIASSGNRVLIELADANITGWPVRRIERIADASAFVRRVREGANLEEVAFVTDLDPADGFVPAKLQIVPTRGSLRLTGQANGRAFVVLPIQYTRCWRLRDLVQRATSPIMVRTDLGLIGILFEEEMDVVLNVHVGGWGHAKCLIDEAAELRGLGLSNAATTYPLGALRNFPIP